MSPEQVRGFSADHRSDIFSFGVILYELLSGGRAFPADSSVETMAANGPMALAGPREVAFVIGPAQRSTIGIADTASGRLTRRIATGKGRIQALTASADGRLLYFCADGSVWAVSSSGGDARAVSAGRYAVMDRSGRGLIVVRGESSQIRMFHVPLDGGPEREIPLDRSIPVYGAHAGFFTAGSLDAAGRLLISLSPLDSWFNPLGILDTETGQITRVPGDSSSEYQSAVWTPDGRILCSQESMRATIWRFQPADK